MNVGVRRQLLLAITLQTRAEMAVPRFTTGIPLLVGIACGALGCLDKEAQDPGMIVHEEMVTRVGPPARTAWRAESGATSTAAPTATVRCGCDADGGLHIAAPQGSRVSRSEDAPAEAEIVLADAAPAPLRRSKSLGFIGDNPLGQSRSYGGPWNVPDAVLPPHRHVEPRYGFGGYGYRGGNAPALPYGGASIAHGAPPGWR